jgi:hypothetical protein
MKIINAIWISVATLYMWVLPVNAQKVLGGDYGTGPVDGALRVQKNKYQEYGEGFSSKWMSTSELKFVKKGVIKTPGGTYFCLISMMKGRQWILPDGRSATCTAKGWIYKKQ